jgi:hypothetical protein
MTHKGLNPTDKRKSYLCISFFARPGEK